MKKIIAIIIGVGVGVLIFQIFPNIIGILLLTLGISAAFSAGSAIVLAVVVKILTWILSIAGGYKMYKWVMTLSWRS